MTVDRCLPQLFYCQRLPENTTLHYHFFWTLTSFLVLYTWGNVEIMAGGVHSSISFCYVFIHCWKYAAETAEEVSGLTVFFFLSILILFSSFPLTKSYFICSLMTIVYAFLCSTLPTPVHVEWSIVILASFCVAAGLVGNVISRPRSLPSLLIFGAVFILPVQLMLNRVKVLQIIREITLGRRDQDEELWKMYSADYENQQGILDQNADKMNVVPTRSLITSLQVPTKAKSNMVRGRIPERASLAGKHPIFLLGQNHFSRHPLAIRQNLIVFF